MRDPPVLIFDEPTSGLDAATALGIISLLHGLTRTGRLIFVSIHQPREEILDLFDRVWLLKSGRLVFDGAKNDLATLSGAPEDGRNVPKISSLPNCSLFRYHSGGK